MLCDHYVDLTALLMALFTAVCMKSMRKCFVCARGTDLVTRVEHLGMSCSFNNVNCAATPAGR